MKIRKANNNYPTVNNQESDKVVIDGLMTAEDLVDLGARAGTNTIEQLKQMYPKNEAAELKELSLMDNDQFIQKLKEVGTYNKENIDAFYNNQLLKDEIHKTRTKLQQIYRDYEKTKENSLVYEKDRQIKELQEKIENLQKQTAK